jgi:hypothetical protein
VIKTSVVVLWIRENYEWRSMDLCELWYNPAAH